jgi:hypothetical protein
VSAACQRRSPEQEALTERLEGEPLSFGFDALGDNLDPDRAREIEHARHERLADRVGVDASHESAIELHVPGDGANLHYRLKGLPGLSFTRRRYPRPPSGRRYALRQRVASGKCRPLRALDRNGETLR